jgi:hypothetical protein
VGRARGAGIRATSTSSVGKAADGTDMALAVSLAAPRSVAGVVEIRAVDA